MSSSNEPTPASSASASGAASIDRESNAQQRAPDRKQSAAADAPDEAAKRRSQGDPPPRKDDEKTAASPSLEDQREYLTRVGDTRLYLLTHPESWKLPADALVLPTDRGRHAGKFGEALLSFLSSSDSQLFSFVQGQVFSASASPSNPLAAARPELFTTPKTPTSQALPARLFLAAPFEDGKEAATAEGARSALYAVLEMADQQRIERLAVPILGAGKGQLDGAQAAAALAGVLMGARPRHVREITVLTIDENAAQELRARCSTQPQSLANDLATGEDLLDVEAEVRALADMLILRDTRPPLVVGVLGGWGTGKSFVMNLMQERMREVRSWALSEDEAWGSDPAKRSPFVGHVYPIRFDAWTYAKGNLWASLMQTIVFELNRQLTLERQLVELGISPLEENTIWRHLDALDDAARATLLENELGKEAIQAVHAAANRVDDEALWDQLKRLKQEEHAKLQQTEQSLADKRAELALQQKKLAEKVEGEIERMARWAAWKPLVREVKDVSGRLYGEFASKVAALTGEKRPDGEAPTLRQLLGDTGLWWKIKKARPQERVGFVVAAAAAAATPLLDGVLQGWQAPTWAIAGGAALIAVQRTWTTWSAWLEEQQTRYEKQVLEERARLDGLRAEIADKQRADDEKKAQAAAVPTISQIEQSVRELEAQAKAQRQRIGLTAGYVSLTAFVQSRLGDGLYEKQLGLLHQVQRDLTELSTSLVVSDEDPHLDKKRGIFPRGVPRIVLFIDDLDRCPPESVVAVLEAAQLLVKSELFVVVIAMDVRFVTRALEKHYSGILVRKGDPCGLDYIEKIIQVPYRVRPIEPAALRRYLRRQMNLKEEMLQPVQGGGGAPGAAPARGTQVAAAKAAARSALPPQVLQFTPSDHALLARCCAELELSPRSLKRLVNVCKLLKIIWYRSARHTEPVDSARQAVVLLLALSARYADILREPLDAVADAIESGSTECLSAFLRDHALFEQDRLSQQDWADVVEVLKDDERLSQTLRLDEIGLPTMNLVRAFSFVGDSGYEPDDLLVRRHETPSALT